MKRIIALLITLGLTVLGLWAFATAFPSDAQLAQESASNIANYRPMCDHKEMRSRDVCMRFGKNAKTQSYAEMVEEYNRENSPEGLRGRYNARIWFGVGLLVVGLGGLALVIRAFVRRRKAPPSLFDAAGPPGSTVSP
jgi:hypothetical protein